MPEQREITVKEMEEFSRTFIVNYNNFGLFRPGKVNQEKHKQEGYYTHITNNLLSEVHIREHLEGKTGLAIVPLSPENTTSFGVLDIDTYVDQEELRQIVNLIDKYNMPLVPFRSKSGGLHIYLFFTEKIESVKMIEYMHIFKNILGFGQKNIEIFPKQTSLSNNKGSLLNAPFYNMLDTKRYLYEENFTPCKDFMKAMTAVKMKQQTVNTIESYLNNLPLNDAPPCLQHSYLKSNTEYRNNYLFSMAVYYKGKMGDDYEKQLTEANNKLTSPLPVKEVSNIIDSVEKNNYSYRCKDAPLCQYCDKNLCKKRLFGFGAQDVFEFPIEGLTEYKGAESYYIWKVNEKDFYYDSIRDLRNQSIFIEKCLQYLHYAPKQLTGEKWRHVLNTAFKNITVEKISGEDDTTEGGEFQHIVMKFCNQTFRAPDKKAISHDQLYFDKSKNSYIFKWKALFSYIKRNGELKNMSGGYMQKLLASMGGKKIRYCVKKSVSVRAWEMPKKTLCDIFPDYMNKEKIEIEWDLEDIYKEEKY